MKINLVKITAIILVLHLFTAVYSQDECVAHEPDGKLRSETPPVKNPFIHVEKGKIVTPDGEPFFIKGMAFVNEVWANSSLPPANHHGKVDYARLKNMGFNSVRFYLNYQIFEDDQFPFTYKKTGFNWLDKNIAWAKEQGIYLVPNMHIP